MMKQHNLTNRVDTSASPVSTTECCVVGAGPGGMILATLLARAGVQVTLLEMHSDFDREFRGETFHSTTMQLMADLGLQERVEAILRTKLGTLHAYAGDKRLPFINLASLGGPFPYVGIVPQVDFLELMAAGAAKFPSFQLIMKATARELIIEAGRVVGVQYRRGGEMYELRAPLVVAADGRSSRLRRLAGLKLETTAPPMDILWFQLPHGESDRDFDPLALRFGSGTVLIMIDRGENWQVGFIILKGSAGDLRKQGIEILREKVTAIVPPLGARMESIKSWKDVAVLSVQTGRVKKWYRPGLLLIGDAAHVMSPIGGVGVNYAINDAIAAANLLTESLLAGSVDVEQLRQVQSRRELPTKFIQRFQTFLQNRIIARALVSERPFELPWAIRTLARMPLLQRIPALIIARGLRPERLQGARAKIS